MKNLGYLGYGLMVQTILVVAASNAFATTYYVDSATGNNSNSGTSTSTPWLSLSKVNGFSFSAGDQVLFKKDGVWSGQLRILSSGTSLSPITFGSYGSGTNKPRINGGGGDAAISLGSTVSNVNVDGFYLTNYDGSGLSDGAEDARSGILLEYGATGTQQNVTLSNNEITLVEGFSNTPSLTARGASSVVAYDNQYSNAGIFVASNATSNLEISGNNIHQLSCSGISIFTKATSTGCIIRSNIVDNVGADGILVSGQNSPLVELNYCRNIGNNSGTASYSSPFVGYHGMAVCGIWATNCNSAVFQHNYCEGTKKITYDGQAYDFDVNNTGTMVYQYNYSVNNQGGFLLSTGVESGLQKICRYNLSVNDGSSQDADGVQGFFNGNADVYNNVFYRTDSKEFSIAPGIDVSGSFSNNVFYSESSPTNSIGYDTSTRIFRNNSFYGFIPKAAGSNPVFLNPLFVSSSPVVTISPTIFTTASQLTTALNGFKISSSSPLHNSGHTISSNGGYDFWGDALYSGGANIGLDEETGAVVAPSYSPQGGIYTTAQTVTLSTPTSGATIRYTLDGTIPSASNGLTYSSALNIGADATLRAVAIKSGSPDSVVSVSDYRISKVGNGSFENGLTGWTVGPTGTSPVVNDSEGSSDGDYAVIFGAANATSTASLSQTIDTVAGGNYEVSFRFGAFGASGQDQALRLSIYDGSNFIQSINLALQADGSYSPANTVFYTYRSTFTARGSSTTLVFEDRTTASNSLGCDGVLDKVEIHESLNLVNGGFEDNLTGWRCTTPSSIPNSTSYQGIIEGDDALAFGGGNLNGGVIEQVMHTLPGVRYQISYEFGAYGASGQAQVLKLEALDGITVLAQHQKTAYGPGSYDGDDTVFTPYTLSFVAQSFETTIRYSDLTTLGNSVGCDGMLDAVSIGIIPRVINGSFESSLTDWSLTQSNVGEASLSNYRGSTDGSWALVFGQGNVAGTAILSQSIVTLPGRMYALDLDFGAYGGSGTPQALQVAALSGSTVLDSTTIHASGNGNYSAPADFLRYTLDFIPDSDSTTIRLQDLTTLSNSLGCDGVLDFVGSH